MYSSTLSLTSTLDVVGGQRHAPAALPPGMTRYPLYRRLGGPQGRCGRVRRISPPPGFDPRTVQRIAIQTNSNITFKSKYSIKHFVLKLSIKHVQLYRTVIYI